MALLVLITSVGRSDISLRPSAVETLARLGVTNISLAQDSETAVVILEGWALDAGQHEQAAAALGVVDARPLQPIVQMAVSTATTTHTKRSDMNAEAALELVGGAPGEA
jgi:hypothetical protein